MKNLLRIFVILLLCLAVNIDLRAGDARYSLGGGVGNMESFTFKAVLSGNFAIHADLGVKLLATSYGYKGFTRQFAPMWTFEANPNALYQSRIESCSWDWGDMSWFAGGGLSFGVAGVYAYDGYQYAYLTSGAYGKFGLNAIGGLELNWDEIPLAVSLDFRPGYGLLFQNAYGGSFFDWALSASARYVF